MSDGAEFRTRNNKRVATILRNGNTEEEIVQGDPRPSRMLARLLLSDSKVETRARNFLFVWLGVF